MSSKILVIDDQEEIENFLKLQRRYELHLNAIAKRISDHEPSEHLSKSAELLLMSLGRLLLKAGHFAEVDHE